MAKKSDFMQDKLRAFVLELADLKGYENPSTYLNEKLDEVKEFNDFSFECDFYLNIHYLCKENADKFWSNSHKNDISDWLRKSRIWTDAFDTTWQALPPQPIVKQKSEQETPKIFDELFYNTDLVDPCIDILKELDPPLIDTDCNYIGKLKGVFCVWIDEMQRQGIVKHYSDRKIFASLIPQKIKRFSIDESMFGKNQSKAETLYRTDIKTKVSKIKLSQDSQ